MFYYLDTSAIIKRYHKETGTEFINSIFNLSKEHIITISSITLLETITVIRKLLNKKIITSREYNDIITTFYNDCKSNKLMIVNIETFHINTAQKLVMESNISAPDAIILASGVRHSLASLV
jgi:predicted nucleic acid-binding protein